MCTTEKHLSLVLLSIHLPSLLLYLVAIVETHESHASPSTRTKRSHAKAQRNTVELERSGLLMNRSENQTAAYYD